MPDDRLVSYVGGTRPSDERAVPLEAAIHKLVAVFDEAPDEVKMALLVSFLVTTCSNQPYPMPTFLTIVEKAYRHIESIEQRPVGHA